MRAAQSPHRWSLIAVLCLATLSFAQPSRADSEGGTPADLHERVIQGLGMDLDGSEAHYLRGTAVDRLPPAHPEIGRLRIALQHGLGYLPLMVARQYGLVEKHAKALGNRELKVVWSRFPSGEAMNGALLSGFLDIATGGVAPMLEAWDRSRARKDVKALAALAAVPLHLNTVNPKVRTLGDFTRRDRIALPTRRVSNQSVVLRMAVAQAFGARLYNGLDSLLVSVPHPEAMRAMLSGRRGITAHFASPPFQQEEEADPRVRTLLSSYDVLGGPATTTTVWATRAFHEDNPRTALAVFRALREAMEIIARDRGKSAQVYLMQSNSAAPNDEIRQILGDPDLVYSVTPLRIMTYARFMARTGELRRAPESWQDVFFSEAQGLSGS